MTDVFAFADDLGPEKIVYMHDPSTDLKAILVIDNIAAGPAIGGTRMASDVSLKECIRLARAMTLKNAAASLPHGGAKSVIFADPKMPRDEKERLMRSFAYALADIKDYIAGPDMGTDETCMAWVHDVIHRSVGLPREIGGIPLDEIGATGFGLTAAIEVACEFTGLDLDGARVVVQGFGSVGAHAARFLEKKGAVLIAAADSRGAILNSGGLDVAALRDWKHSRRPVSEFENGTTIAPDDLVDVECDIWIPAARPDVLTEENAARIQARIFAEGANIPATRAAEHLLADRGILVLPDFIANAGGVICGAEEYRGGTQASAFAVIDEKIRGNMREVLEVAQADAILPRDAAERLAETRVRAAMSLRKTH